MLSKKQRIKYIPFLLMCLTFNVFSQELNISGALDATGYIYETEIADSEATRTKAVSIKPSLLGSYSSRLLSASLAANHTRIKQSDGVVGSIQSYTDSSYTSALTLIENALFLTLSGAQTHRGISQQQAGFSDQLLASGDLTKSRNNNAQLSFSIPNPTYLGFTLNTTYSETKTDQSLDSTNGLDSDNLGVSTTFYQGKNVRSINFNISAQYNETKRASLQNFESTLVRGNFGLPITSNFEFIVIANIEEYETGQTVLSNNNNLDTTSYGTGFKWAPSDERNLSLTYNQLEEGEGGEEGEEKTEFLGVDLAWAFSSRTALNFNYGKRFYGDAYGLDFSHSLKSIRTSISYSEDVTSYSRLNASGSSITGIFVCEFGSTELADCFQPGSLDYELQAGEEFRASGEIDTDISEEVLFRKSGTASIGYEKRKVKVSIDASYLKTEYLESDRLRITRSLRVNLNYTLGRKTDLNFASNLARNQYDELSTPETTVTTTLTLARDIGRYTKLNISARSLDRESDDLARNGNDKRLTVGLSYSF